jgi:multiple sugar transport system ATP-binding protein
MNFLPATVDGNRIELPFLTLDLADDVAEKVQGKGLLIAGIRPEHFEDASLVDQDKRGRGATFNVTIDVTEWLGSEQYAYVPFEAPEDVQKQLTELERELDGESMRSQLVVSLDAASRVRDGETAELFVDASRMHLFDPASGENLTLGTGRYARSG